jgi:hypothetical protein
MLTNRSTCDNSATAKVFHPRLGHLNLEPVQKLCSTKLVSCCKKESSWKRDTKRDYRSVSCLFGQASASLLLVLLTMRLLLLLLLLQIRTQPHLGCCLAAATAAASAIFMHLCTNRATPYTSRQHMRSCNDVNGNCANRRSRLTTAVAGHEKRSL